MTTVRNRRRAGFTLLELIVVIGIIILLAGLTMGAIFRVRDSQMEKTSTENVRKIQTGFEAQWKAAGDQIRAEKSIPQIILDLTKTANGGYDATRAHALHMKLRLRQEFPQTFAEADPKRYMAVFNPTNDPTLNAILSQYPPKATFAVAVAGLPDAPADIEGAVLLYLILNQGRGGVTFNVDGRRRQGQGNCPRGAGDEDVL